MSKNDFFERDSKCWKEFKTQQPFLFSEINKILNQKESPPIYHSASFVNIMFPELDIYDYKKERKEAFKLVLQELLKDKREPQHPKETLQKIAKKYDFLVENNSEIFTTLFQRNNLPIKNQEKIDKILEEFKKKENITPFGFREKAANANFILDDFVPDKSSFMKTQKKSLENDLTKESFQYKKIIRQIKKIKSAEQNSNSNPPFGFEETT